MIEVRGICSINPAKAETTYIITRGDRGDDYKTDLFPEKQPITKGTIRSFLVKKYRVKGEDIVFAPHIAAQII